MIVALLILIFLAVLFPDAMRGLVGWLLAAAVVVAVLLAVGALIFAGVENYIIPLAEGHTKEGIYGAAIFAGMCILAVIGALSERKTFTWSTK